MTSIKYLVITTMFYITLSGCSSSHEQLSSNIPEIYAKAKKTLKYGNLKQAIKQLEAINNSYGPYSQLVQIDLINAYLKNSDIKLAQNTINQFIRLNKIHPNMDFVIYMRAITNMALDENKFQKIFGIDRSDRDSKYILEAFKDFTKLVTYYPNSKYVNEAIKYINIIENRLAKYEYSVAEFYYNKKAWIAVVNRLTTILLNFPNTKIKLNCLKLMKNAYLKLQIYSQAEEVSKLIAIYSK